MQREHAPHAHHQRSNGRASVSFHPQAGQARLGQLYQRGSAKAIVLDASETVFLNTSGGLTGGDRLDYALAAGPGLRITATTQTAERIYRSTTGRAEITVSLDVGAGAHLDWLPQETILFDAAQAKRQTQITLAAGATCLMAETVVLGRAAMGETVARLDFEDRRLIQRGTCPLHLEVLRLDDARLVPSSAGLSDARAMATVVLIAPEAAASVKTLRDVLDEPGVRAAASGLPGRLVVRLLARDGWPLRRQMVRVLTALRGAALPRVWQM
ncbi:MAG: urease accessory protein UreD [Roseinatronobacter sp.]